MAYPSRITKSNPTNNITRPNHTHSSTAAFGNVTDATQNYQGSPEPKFKLLEKKSERRKNPEI